MKTKRREIIYSIPAYISSNRIVKGWEVMRNIHNTAIGNDLKQLPLHCSYEIVLLTDIGSEG
jgi:hypothetical protein